MKMGDFEEDEPEDFLPDYDHKGYLILMVDCAEEMFVGGKAAPFLTALKAAYNFYDQNITSFLSACDTLSIVLCHSDINKQIFIDNKAQAVESYKKIFECSKKSLDDLKNEYLCQDTGPFSVHLLNAMNQIKARKSNNVYFITTRANPVSNPADKFEALRLIGELKKETVNFEVLCLKNELDMEFYGEIYSFLGKQYDNVYYQLDHLAEKLHDSVHHKIYAKRHFLYPFLGSKNYISVESFSLQQSIKLMSNCNVHKTTKELLRCMTIEDDNSKTEYTVKLQKDGQLSVILTRDQYDRAIDTSVIPTGISLIKAQHERISTPGVDLAPPRLLKMTTSSEKPFKELWQAMHDLYILCYTKYSKTGPIRHTELKPVKINDEFYFEMRFLPNGEHLFIEHDLNKVAVETEDDQPESAAKRKDAFDQLIDNMTIDNPQELFNNMISGEDSNNIEYFKSQLLGREYIVTAIKDPADIKWYEADEEDIANACEILEEASVPLLKPKGKKRARN